MENLYKSELEIPTRINIEKALIDVVTLSSGVEYALTWLSAPVPGVVMAINPEKVRAIGQSSDLQIFNRDASLAIPDGMGVVLAAKFLGYRSIQRVTGIDFCETLLSRCGDLGVNIFFYGAKPGVAEQAVKNLMQIHKNLRVVGVEHGYQSETEQASLVHKIRASGAQVLIVALGSPRQEQWIKQNLPNLGGVRIVQGVGGSFDVFAGNVGRAPIAWQNIGLEWLYRLLKQPSRFPRYAKLVYFVPVLGRSLFRKRRKHND